MITNTLVIADLRNDSRYAAIPSSYKLFLNDYEQTRYFRGGLPAGVRWAQMDSYEQSPWDIRRENILNEVNKATRDVHELIIQNVDNYNKSYDKNIQVRITSMSNKIQDTKGEFRLKIGDFWF
jgi:hypothetical protein